MKKVIKMTVATVCVVAAGMGGMKAYNVANQSEADLLLSENVEALSAGEGYRVWHDCPYTGGICTWLNAYGDLEYYSGLNPVRNY